MVSTRGKRGAVEAPVLDSDDIPKELRKLYIDGKDTMRGEKRKVGEAEVYWWRGAAYAITDDTPREWIEAEAEKHKHKPKESESKKRVMEEDEDGEERSVKKRRSTGAVNPQKNLNKTKTRHSFPNLPTTRPRTSSNIQQEEREPTPPYKSPDEAMQEFILDRKAEARKAGKEVDPLPEPRTTNQQIALSFGLLGRLNAQIAAKQERYNKVRLFKAVRLSIKKRKAEDTVEEPPQENAAVSETIEEVQHPNSDLVAQLRAAIYGSEPAPRAQSTNALPSPDTTPEADNDASSDRHDSAAASDPPHTTNTSIEDPTSTSPDSEAVSGLRESPFATLGDRAEDNISRARIMKESKQARRRRVQRERKMLETLGVAFLPSS